MTLRLTDLDGAQAEVWKDLIRRWRENPLTFVLEAFFRIREEEWTPWRPGEVRPEEIPVGPELWQGEFLRDVARARVEGRRRFTVRAGHGVGKALGVDEPVLTPHGWVRIGDIRIGDMVASADGTWTKVIGVYPQGVRDRYRVWLNDGTSVVTDGDHLWLTTTRAERKRGVEGRVRTTREIAGSLHAQNGRARILNHCLPRLKAVRHLRAVVPVEPYVLGVWLGDGVKQGYITTNALDRDIVAGCGGRTVWVDRGTVVFRAEGLTAGLRVLGLYGVGSHERFIPRCYLHGSIGQRVALLQGLLDTDGTVGRRNNAVVFETTSERLADDVSELVRSLGGVVRRGSRRGKYCGVEKRWSYRVYISLPEEIAPFRCARKAEKYRPVFGSKNRDRTLSRFVARVEPVGAGETVCIAVDHPSKLYVTRDHIVTHNTTLQAWLILWFVIFHRDLKVPVTANSQDQLRDVVWAEIGKWHRMLPDFLREQVEVTAERVQMKVNPETAFAVARTTRPERPEALQGFHAGTLAFFIEEASGIDDVIFETAGGALSSEDSWVFMFGNPTRTSGYFYKSHHEKSAQWRTYHVPCSASLRVADNYSQEIEQEYGRDSNVYRVRVLGEFPLTEDDGVLSLGLVRAAMDRDVVPSESGVVWGLDVARFGDDSTALAKRRGNVLLEPVKEWRKLDLMQVAGVVAREYQETPIEKKPAAINIDAIGLGAGVADRLRELGLPARAINVGESPSVDQHRYMRLRDELWWRCREWFETRAVRIPEDKELIAELVAPKYRMESSGKIKIESKDEMKKRGLKSPNKADALCLTFAGGDLVLAVRRRVTTVMEYDPFRIGGAEYEREIGRQSVAGMEYAPW